MDRLRLCTFREWWYCYWNQWWRLYYHIWSWCRKI